MQQPPASSQNRVPRPNSVICLTTHLTESVCRYVRHHVAEGLVPVLRPSDRPVRASFRDMSLTYRHNQRPINRQSSKTPELIYQATVVRASAPVLLLLFLCLT